MEIAEGTRKRSRRSSDGGSSGGDGGDQDRLSALPDCLLHVIMSSLKARQVVQTCVLSTRWRHLWRSVPCLDVDIAEFRRSSGGHSSSSSDSDDDSSDDTDIVSDYGDSDSDSDYDTGYFNGKGQGWEDFEDFAANLMFRCNMSQLDSFRLDIDRGRKPRFNDLTDGAAHDSWTYSGLQAEAWLRRAMKYCTPSQRQGLNMSTCSWRLKRLHLCYIPLYYSFGEHLRSACRSLEDLELDHCICEIRSIACDSLKNLVLKNCSFCGVLSDIACPVLKTLVINGGSNGCATPNPLAISAPMVAYLRIDLNAERFHAGITINKTMPSLERASIHLRRHKYGSPRGMFGRPLYGDQSELLCSVSNATSLELSGVGPLVLDKEPKFVEFQNLRNLLLGNCDLTDDFRLLWFFHRGSPNLEKVTLRHCKFPSDSDDKEETYNDADGIEGTHSDSDDKEGMHNLENTSSFDYCYGQDFLHDENQRNHTYTSSSIPDLLRCPHPQFLGDSDSFSSRPRRRCVHFSDSDSEDSEARTCKLDTASSSDHRYGLDFLRDENIELEIIHKNGNPAYRSADKLVLDLPLNSKGTTDDVVTDTGVGLRPHR